MNYIGDFKDNDGNRYYPNLNFTDVGTTFSGDLNNIKKTCFLYADGNATNIPLTGYSFYVTTIALNNNYVHQRASRASSSLENFSTYERQCYSGSWTDWNRH